MMEHFNCIASTIVIIGIGCVYFYILYQSTKGGDCQGW